VRLHVRLHAWLAVFAIFGLWACQRPAGPSLLQVTGVASTRLREGDFLELRGRAFPEGRKAEVTLRGEVNRAGEPRTTGFELVLSGQSVSPHAVTVEVTRSVERALGGVTKPSHATFRGSVEVSFAPRVAGTPPVTGHLPEVELDFVPAEGDHSLATARRDEGRRFIAFAGLLLLEGASGLTVDGVMPKSPAERAGVVRGDRLLELAGVRLLDIADFVPPPRVRSTELVVERSGVLGRTRLALDVEGFRKASPRDFATVASVIAAVVALYFLLASPLGRAVSFVEWRLIEALRLARARREPRPGRAPSPARRKLRVPVTFAEVLALLVGSGIVTALGLGGSLVARELDVPIVLAALVVALALSALVFGVPGESGVLARVRRFVLVLARALPVAAAVIALVAEVGSFGPDDLLSAQGPLPWQWLLFRGPLELGLGLAWLVALIPETSLGSSPCQKLAATRPPAGKLVQSAFLGELELVVSSGAFALAFLGGSRLGAIPGGSLSLGLLLGGAGLLLVKTWATVALVLGVRALLGRIDVSEASLLLSRGVVPASLLLSGVVLLVRRSSVIVAPGAETAISWGCLVVCLALAVALARRVLSVLRSGSAEPGLNPWI
jgi:hypothetical protein